MPGVVCAIRGGPQSRPTIKRAIELARATNLPLYFLFVVNLDFLSQSTSTRTNSISKDLHQMGMFILLTAQSMAEAHGIRADRVVRHGNVAKEIITLSREVATSHVVLGYPVRENEENVFSQDRLRKFSRRIAAESGAEVVLVEVSEHEAP